MLVLVYFASDLNYCNKYINPYMYIEAEYKQIIHTHKIILGYNRKILLMYRIDLYNLIHMEESYIIILIP